MRKLFGIFIFIVLITVHSTFVVVGDQTLPPKTMFKASYISWDDLEFVDESSFETAYESVLDELNKHHMNVVIFDVGPLLQLVYEEEDLFFINSDIHEQLLWMIETTIDKGFEFHVSLHPFLVAEEKLYDDLTIDDFLNVLDENHFAAQHPEDLIVGDDQLLYVNWTKQSVNQFINNAILYFIDTYPVQAIHLGSELYPEQSEIIEDPSFQQLEQIRSTIERFNVQHNKSIQFGLTYSLDSNWGDIDEFINYDTFDYIILNRGYQLEDDLFYDYLANLSDNHPNNDVNLYIYDDIERLRPKFLHDILVNDRNELNVKGIALSQIIPHMKSNSEYYQSFVNTAESTFKQSPLLPPVANVFSPNVSRRIISNVEIEDDVVTLYWQPNHEVKQYVIYRFDYSEEFSLEALDDASKILAIIPNADDMVEIIEYHDETVKSGKKYKYVVTTIDYTNHELSIPNIHDADLTIDDRSKEVIILFTITSIIGLSVVIYSSVRVFK